MIESIGEIKLFSGGKIPENFLLCDGRYIPISQYRDLYNVIGSRFGSRVGQFRLPNLVGSPIRSAKGHLEPDYEGSRNISYRGTRYATREKVVIQTFNEKNVYYAIRYKTETVSEVLDIVHTDRDTNESQPSENSWKDWYLKRLQDSDVVARLEEIFDTGRGKGWLEDDMLNDADIQAKIESICQDPAMTEWLISLINSTVSTERIAAIVRQTLSDENIRKIVEVRN